MACDKRIACGDQRTDVDVRWASDSIALGNGPQREPTTVISSMTSGAWLGPVGSATVVFKKRSCRAAAPAARRLATRWRSRCSRRPDRRTGRVDIINQGRSESRTRSDLQLPSMFPINVTEQPQAFRTWAHRFPSRPSPRTKTFEKSFTGSCAGICHAAASGSTKTAASSEIESGSG